MKHAKEKIHMTKHCEEASQDFGLSTYIALSVRTDQSVTSVLLLSVDARTFLELELNRC